MTVAPRSCDAPGDRPRGRMPPPPPATQASSFCAVTSNRLPPPPATIPSGFRPAFLGPAPSRSASGSDAAAGIVVRASGTRPARRASASSSRSTSSTRSSPPTAIRPSAAPRPLGQRGSRDARGDHPRGRLPAPPSAFRAIPHQFSTATRLPPPPATFPLNFRPAYFGPAAPRSKSGPGSAICISSSPARPACRAPSAASRYSPPSRTTSPYVHALATARLQVAAANPVLATPSTLVCSGVNAALASWHARGCPSVGPLRAGILRRGSGVNSSASRRPKKTVTFSLPAPRIEACSASSVRPLGASNHLAAPSSAVRGSRSPPTEEGWTLVTSRREKREARLLGRDSSPHFRRRTSTQRPSHLQHQRQHQRPYSTHAPPPRNPARRCRRCNAREHATLACRDPVRCDRCGRSGHWAIACHDHLRRPLPASASTPSKATPRTFQASPAPLRRSNDAAATPLSLSRPIPRGRVQDTERRRDDQDRRRSKSRARHGSGCDVRVSRRDARDDDDEEVHRRRKGGLRRSESWWPSAAPDARDRVRVRTPRRRSPSRGLGRQRQVYGHATLAAADTRLKSIVVVPATATQAAPPHPRLLSIVIAPTPTPPTPPAISHQQVIAHLKDLMHTGLAAACDVMPSSLGVASPTRQSRSITPSTPPPFSLTDEETTTAVRSSPAVHAALGSSFSILCRSWTDGIRSAPPGFTASSSRLASPILCSDAATPRQGAPLQTHAPMSSPPILCAWGLEEDVIATAPAVGLPSPHSPLRSVPLTWDEEHEEQGNEVWFDEKKMMEAARAASPAADTEEQEELLFSPLQSAELEIVKVPDAAQADADYAAAGENTDVLNQDTSSEEVSDLLLNEEDERTVIGDLLQPEVQLHIGSIDDLFDRPPVPLLPSPLPLVPIMAAPLEESAQITLERRSSRLAAKPQIPAVDKAILILHNKLGIEDGLPFVQAHKEYMDTYKTTLNDSAMSNLNRLFKLNNPSIMAADEALITLAGPGGAELASSSTTALDFSA